MNRDGVRNATLSRLRDRVTGLFRNVENSHLTRGIQTYFPSKGEAKGERAGG